MKALFSRAKRGLAWVLTLCLLMSGANLGLVSQAMAGSFEDVTVGAVMAENYGLTGAEKEIYSLLGDTIQYYEMDDTDKAGLVTVEENTVKAPDYQGWTATTADIVVGGVVAETVVINEGEGTIAGDHGNVFSVEVTYVNEYTPAADKQEELIQAVADLKQGVDNTDAVSAQSGNLFILEAAMPELVNLANTGIKVGSMAVKLSDECKAAIYALNDQMTGNGG